MLAAGIILAIMIVPIISSISREVIMVVPQHQREGVLALGATRWEMIRVGVLRNARAGIVGGVILRLRRQALGDTMAVATGRSETRRILPSLLLFAPGYTMASVLANEFSEATGDVYLSALIEIGLALFRVTIIVNALAQPPGVDCHPGPACEGTCLAVTGGASVQAGMPPISWRRRLTDHVMTGAAVLTVVIVLAPLIAIFGYLVYRGVGSINWPFLTNIPAPEGEVGGGMANAICGLVHYSQYCQPDRGAVRVGAGIYLAEFGRNRLGRAVSFHRRTC